MVLTNTNTRVTIIYPNLVYWYSPLPGGAIVAFLRGPVGWLHGGAHSRARSGWADHCPVKYAPISGPFNWIGSARTAFPLLFLLLGDGDFSIAGVLARFGGLVELLLGVSTFFACFAVADGISSGKGSFCSGFFRVTILVNITGAHVDIFPSRNQDEDIEIFGLTETNIKESEFPRGLHLGLFS